MSSGHLSASEINARLNHPVIDADGHWLEYGPFIYEEFRRIGGDTAADGFWSVISTIQNLLETDIEERRDRMQAQQGFWTFPAQNAKDRATAMMPALLNHRLDELGMDYTLIYPTIGLGLHRIPNDHVRQVTCRAYNTFVAEYFADYSDRMTPAAIIPMFTPEEAISELEYVSNTLGIKVIMVGSLIPRLTPKLARENPDVAPTAPWFDVLGIDSPYDYDPVWAKCEELKLSPTFHRGSRGFGLRRSPSNFVYNHVGHFAAANEAVCKALLMGGVTRRFPNVKFGFLEGGVGWASQLLADIIEHWEKRSLEGLENTNPDNINLDAIMDLAKEFGKDTLITALRDSGGRFDGEGSGATGKLENLDDFSKLQILEETDFLDLFVDSFYFGCEADDRMVSLAFNRDMNALNARLNTLFGSDFGHFDVTDFTHVLPEVYELVEDGLLTDDNLRDFLFTNPVRFFGGPNPDFFKGTAVENQAAALLAAEKAIEQTKAAE